MITHASPSPGPDPSSSTSVMAVGWRLDPRGDGQGTLGRDLRSMLCSIILVALLVRLKAAVDVAVAGVQRTPRPSGTARSTKTLCFHIDQRTLGDVDDDCADVRVPLEPRAGVGRRLWAMTVREGHASRARLCWCHCEMIVVLYHLRASLCWNKVVCGSRSRGQPVEQPSHPDRLVKLPASVVGAHIPPSQRWFDATGRQGSGAREDVQRTADESEGDPREQR